MKLGPAQLAPATQHEIELEIELVKLALRAAQHQPNLMAVYAGPTEWLEEARSDPGHRDELADYARSLAAAAMKIGHAYVAGQAHSIELQLEAVDREILPYDQMVAGLLGVELATPSRDEAEALRAEVIELASRLEPGPASRAVERWEGRRLLTGEAKWDAAIETYRAGRRYVFGGSFPLDISENLELARIDDQLWSVNLSWNPGRRLAFQVNVETPRTPQALAFEVAHNIYPGDYLHLAALHQHTYLRRGHVAACIKLKNAPESVISEGIEETAYLRLYPDPDPQQLLATRLEWLRRIATFRAAVQLRLEGRTDDETLRSLARDGFMSYERANFQLRLIKHPLWGPYQYTYLLGRRLVEEADRRMGSACRSAAYLEYLYCGLHTPQTFLPGLDQIGAA